jgi:hypothetical protein
MDGTIRVVFNSEAARNSFFEYVDRYEYRLIYDNGQDRPQKGVSWMGDNSGNCRIYLQRRSVINFERLGHDIQMFGGRIEMR